MNLTSTRSPLKYRSKISKAKAVMLGSMFVVEHKVYVPRGAVNTSFFNVYKILSETEAFYQVESIPLVELQFIRNHLAKARGESEWAFDFLYNADSDNTWVALGITDADKYLRDNAQVFINIIQNREEDYKKKMEARVALMAERRAQKKEAESKKLGVA